MKISTFDQDFFCFEKQIYHFACVQDGEGKYARMFHFHIATSWMRSDYVGILLPLNARIFFKNYRFSNLIQIPIRISDRGQPLNGLTNR